MTIETSRGKVLGGSSSINMNGPIAKRIGWIWVLWCPEATQMPNAAACGQGRGVESVIRRPFRTRAKT